MIAAAQSATSSSDSWSMYLTIVTVLFLIIQTIIIAFQTRILRRQTKILEEQAHLGESVELSITPLHQDPITSPNNQVRLKVTNEGKGLAKYPHIRCMQVHLKSGTITEGESSQMQPIGPGRHEEVTIDFDGPITKSIPLKCSWGAIGSNGLAYGGRCELSF